MFVPGSISDGDANNGGHDHEAFASGFTERCRCVARIEAPVTMGTGDIEANGSAVASGWHSGWPSLMAARGWAIDSCKRLFGPLQLRCIIGTGNDGTRVISGKERLAGAISDCFAQSCCANWHR